MFRHLPTLHSRLIPRPRLIHIFQRHAKVSCSAIVAPAGFGKTTVAAQWMHQIKDLVPVDLNPIWILVRERDADPWQFADHILEEMFGVAEMREDIDAVRALLRIQKISAQEAVASVIRSASKLTTTLLLALDDVHLADSTESKALLQLLIDIAHDRFKLMLVTRSLLDLRLPAESLILKTNDLRFDHDEYLEYAQGARLSSLNPQDLTFLEKRCEGWITALQLLALTPDIRAAATTMQQSTDASREYLAEYLDRIVLQTLDTRMRNMLTRCAVIPFITPFTAARLTGMTEAECSALLEQAVASNYFLQPYSDERTTNAFRTHPLFREFLRRQLRREVGRDELHMLQHNAAEFLVEAGDIDDALDLLLQIEDFNAATALIARFSRQTLLEFDLITMHSRISRLPPEHVDRFPGLVVDLALTEVCKGSSGRRQALDRARRCIEQNRAASDVSNPQQQVTAEHELELEMLEAITCFFEGELERARKHVQLALNIPMQPSGLALGLLHIAQSYAPENPADLQTRILHTSEAAAVFQSIGFTHAYVSTKNAQALFYRRAGNGVQALAAFDQALYESDRQAWMRVETSIDICIDYAETLYWMNQLPEARLQLKRIESSSTDYEITRYAFLKADLYRQMPALRQTMDFDAIDINANLEADQTHWRKAVVDKAPSMIGEFAFLRILRDAQHANFSACTATLRIAGISCEPQSDDDVIPLTDAFFDAAATIHENMLLAALTYAVLAGKVGTDVERHLRNISGNAHEQANMPLRIRAHTLLALNSFGMGDQAGMEAHLASLLPLVKQSRMPRLMLIHPSIDPMLVSSNHPYAAILLAQHRGTDGRIDSYGLTKRELELLQMLADGKSPTDAAEETGITIATARWHIKHVCRKMNTPNYRTAVRVYREITEI